jgi:Xaa-Pro aminopeptidase
MNVNDIFKKRLQNLRIKMKLKNTDAVFITQRENYMYMSGFTGTSAILFITDGKAVLLTDFRYVEQASRQAAEYEIVQYNGSFINELNDLIENEKVERLSFEDAHLSFAEYSEYHEKLKVAEFLPLGGVVEELRRVKDESEITLVKKAVKIADDAFAHILSYIKPGVAEVEIAAEMEFFMKRQGATGPSFDTIIASGKRASMPHGVASEKKIEQGDVITMDYGALYNGYCSDITRTVFLGKPDSELERIYKIVLEAQLKGLEEVKSDRTGKEIDAVVRTLIADAGFGDNFGHGLGHGVGLEIHEEPTLSMRGSIELKDGMVVTVEPGIYVPELGGVRIEDMLVVKGDIPCILTAASKELVIL